MLVSLTYALKKRRVHQDVLWPIWDKPSTVSRVRKRALPIGQLPDDANAPIELARALVKGAKWPEIQKILGNLRDENPEGIRKIVLGYVTTILLDNKDETLLSRYLPILDEFSQQINYADGISPIVLASARCVLNARRITRQRY